MSKFKVGDNVVHLGGVRGELSRNRGKVLTILEGPIKIEGFSGYRYIVDKPLFADDFFNSTSAHHANEQYLLKLT